MLVYVPVTDFSSKTIHGCMEIESTKAKYHKSINYSNSIHYNGTIYNGDNIYKNKDGVYAFWNRYYKGMAENELKAEEIEWKEHI